jgi:hypothetical protein
MRTALAIKETYHEFDRVDRYLLIWAAWYRHCQPRIGYPGASLGFETGGITCYDDLEHECDEYAGRTVNALIDDLPPAQGCAVRRIYLGEPWRFPRYNMTMMYELARERIERGLNQWGLA